MDNETYSNDTANNNDMSTLTALSLSGILGVALIIANTMVLYLVYKNHTLRTVTNNFLVSLAISDLSTGLVAIPIHIACSLTLKQDTCIAMDVFLRFLGFSTVAHLTVLTLERYIRITKPFTYRSRVTSAFTCRVIAGMWMFSLISSLVQLIWIKDTSMSDHDLGQIEIIYDFVSFAIVVVVPFFVISAIYIAIFVYIRKHNKKRQEVLALSSTGNSSETTRERRVKTGERRVLLVFLAMIIVFILGSFLHFLWTILLDITEYQSHPLPIDPSTLEKVIISILFFRFFSSLCNPLLLTYFKNDFYEALKALWRDVRRQR